MLSVDIGAATVRLQVSTGCLRHVYAPFEGVLTLGVINGGNIDGEATDRIKGGLCLASPEGYSPEYHVTGDMATSDLVLDMKVVGQRNMDS